MKKIILTLAFFANLTLAQTTIYLTRHAEKSNSVKTKDPVLSEIGMFRAANIAKQLSQLGITHIYSTNYKRTRLTAKPLADHLGLEVKKYDPSNLKDFATLLKNTVGNILVVGHSNTTPQLTALLSNEKIEPMNEHDYDNLYQVIIDGDEILLNQFKTIPSYFQLNNKK